MRVVAWQRPLKYTGQNGIRHVRTCNFNTTKLQRAEKRKQTKYETDTESARKVTGQSCGDTASTSTMSTKDKCIFCNSGKESGDLHRSSTHNINKRVRKCAVILEDTLLLGKLIISGVMMAQDAKYHAKCLVALYRKLCMVMVACMNVYLPTGGLIMSKKCLRQQAQRLYKR